MVLSGMQLHLPSDDFRRSLLSVKVYFPHILLDHPVLTPRR